MKHYRLISGFLCLCFIGSLVIVFFTRVQPGLLKMNLPGSATQPVNRATEQRLPKEINEERNKTAEKVLTRDETPLKFKADYWHNHTRFACKSLGMSTNVSDDQEKSQAVVDDKHKGPGPLSSTNISVAWRTQTGQNTEKLIMCLNAKAGSSYLVAVFAILLGQDPAKDPKDVNGKRVYTHYKYSQPQLAKMSYEGKLKRQTTFYSAILVREPFGRLLSAYRDKIEEPPTPTHVRIARKIRKNRKGNTTFSEFVEYVVNNEDDKNPHWKPYYQACSPCSVDYDFVAKMETMHEDMKHIFEEVNVTDIIVPPKPGRKTADVYLEKYYKQISKENLWKVYERYKPDFVIFDYEVPEVIRAMMI